MQRNTEKDVYDIVDIQELILLVGQASAGLRDAQYNYAKAHRTLLGYIDARTIQVNDHLLAIRGASDGTQAGGDGED